MPNLAPLQSDLISLVSGLVSSFILLEIIGKPLRQKASSNIDQSPPKGIKARDWNRVISVAKGSEGGGKWMGRFELLLFFAAFWIGTPELIAGWLVFKVGSKWQTWGSIVKIPDRLKGVSDLEYLRARHAWGSFTLTRFLFGTLSNIIFALIGTSVGLTIKNILLP